ncbi:hypothetical protein, partial [Staphylococcus aureus]
AHKLFKQSWSVNMEDEKVTAERVHGGQANKAGILNSLSKVTKIDTVQGLSEGEFKDIEATR